jgi:hypothetical protein
VERTANVTIARADRDREITVVFGKKRFDRGLRVVNFISTIPCGGFDSETGPRGALSRCFKRLV